jgi:SnoaL-like domain
LTRFTRIALVVVAALGLVLAWRSWGPSDERAVRQRLDALTVDLNATAGEGLGAVAHAADLGSFFNDDVIVDLGEGATPIVGRATLVGMASRLQRRTAAFRLRFDDVGVRLGPDRTTADVTLTASFVARADGADDDSMDAREFTLNLTKRSGVWRIGRVTAVDTLR